MTGDLASGSLNPDLTLGDIVGFKELGLNLAAGSPGALRRPVAGVHAIEIEEPTRWLQRSWLPLTVGTRLRGSRSAQRALVEELADFGAAGLGFGTGVVFKAVPPAVIETADRVDLPLVEVPLRTPFREVIAAFYRLGSGGDLHTTQRLVGMQRHLLDALGHEPTSRGILARLSELVHAPVAIVVAPAQVEIAAGEAAWDELLSRLDGRRMVIVQVDAGETAFIAVPVSGEAEWSGRLLAVAQPSGAASTDFIKLALRIAAPLLASLQALEDVAASRQRAIDAAVVEGLIGPDPFGRRVAARHAEELGLAAGAIVAAAILPRGSERPTGQERASLVDLTKALRAGFAAAQLPCLLLSAENSIRAVVRGDPRSVAAILEAAVPSIVAGLHPADSLDDVANAIGRAELAARSARERGLRRPLFFGELDTTSLLVGSVPPELLQAKREELEASFAGEPMLMETLLAFFANRLDTGQTAKVLHLHPNSLRYRLSRIEAVLGRPLRDPATIAELQFLLAGRDLWGS